jgi:hypothetical protein
MGKAPEKGPSTHFVLRQLAHATFSRYSSNRHDARPAAPLSLYRVSN